MAGIKKYNYSVSDIFRLSGVDLESYVNYMSPVLIKRAERTAKKYPTHSKPRKRLEQLRGELNSSDMVDRALAVRYWSSISSLSERGYAKSLRGSWEWVQSAGINEYGVTRKNVYIFTEFMEWARAVIDSSNLDSDRLYQFFQEKGSAEIKKALDSDRDALLKAYERFLLISKRL